MSMIEVESDPIASLWDSYHRERSIELRNRLVSEYYGFVKILVWGLKRTLPKHEDAGDLVSAGVLGLIEAIENWDPARGAQFKTFATMKIRCAVMDELRRKGSFSKRIRGRLNRIKDAAGLLTEELGREPSAAEIAAKVGIPASQVEECLSLQTLQVYPFSALRSDGCRTPEDLIVDSRPQRPDQDEKGPGDGGFEALIQALNPTAQAILRLRYGQDQSFPAISRAVSRGVGTVHAAHAKALKTMREQLSGREAFA